MNRCWIAEEVGPGTSRSLPVRPTLAYYVNYRPFISFEWTDAKGGGWGGPKVSVGMTLSGDEIDI